MGMLNQVGETMHYQEKFIYVGVDLHKETHTAVIINCWHQKLGEIQFANKPSAFPELIKAVKKHSKGLTPVYGLEDVGGHGRSLAVYLNEQNQSVKEVNAALAHSLRLSRPIVHKSDSWDAECIANTLLANLNTLPDANPQDLYWTIGQLVLRRRALVKAMSALTNQLHGQLTCAYPSYKQFFSEVDGKTALIFWEKYPSPHHLDKVSQEELTAFLRECSNNACSTSKAQQILELIKKDGDTKRGYQNSRDFLVRSIVRDIQFKKQEIARVEAELKTVMSELDYKLESMPGISTVTAAELVTEIGDVRRFSSANKLARHAGIAPVSFGSGGKSKTIKSKQGNKELHSIIYFLAVRQIGVDRTTKKPRNEVFYNYYTKKVAEGKTKGQALICVMRRLVNIIYGMMKNKTEYMLPAIPEKEAV